MNTYQIAYPRATVTYAELSDDTLACLYMLKPEQHIVTEANIETIRLALNIKDLTDDELTYVRNSVVKAFDSLIHYHRTMAEHLSAKGSESKAHWKEYDDNMTRMSMITCVIDNEKWNRGLAI